MGGVCVPTFAGRPERSERSERGGSRWRVSLLTTGRQMVLAPQARHGEHECGCEARAFQRARVPGQRQRQFLHLRQ